MNEQRTGTIRTALQQLDPANAEHWTDDGLPKTGVVQRIAKDSTISRKEIQEAWPNFERPAPETAPAPDFAEAATPPADALPVALDGTIAGSAEAGEAPPIDDETPMTADEIRQALEANVADAEAGLLDARKRHAQAANDIPVLINAVAAARKELNRQFPPMSAQDNIREYIETQNALRAARVNAGAMPSTLDASFGRLGGSRYVNPRRAVQGADGNLVKNADGSVARPRPQQTRPIGALGRQQSSKPVRSGAGVPATGRPTPGAGAVRA
jgi:hypothetical protein